jgi:hypothetical protein
MDINEIRRWHSVFKRDGELFEIRILCGGGKIYSGYFTDIEKALALLPSYDMFQIYFTVNEVKSACSSRKQFDTFLTVSGSATSKNDIEHRWLLPVDIDVERPSDVSSTDEEKGYAHKKACEVYKFLRDAGFSLPIVCDSSSGYHIYYPIDMPNTAESESVVRKFYEVLSNLFSDEKVKIDKVVGDANRIMRLYGTWGRKGRNTQERPHRMAKILAVPQEVTRMKREQIESFIEKYSIKTESVQHRAYNGIQGESFSLRDFIAKYEIRVAKELPISGGGTKYVLEECPFDSQHKAPDSALFELPNGSIAFKCFHDSCAQHDWRAFRLHFDPHAYEREKQDFSSQTRYRQVVPHLPQKPKYEIKDEIPELGKKWLSMSDIQKVDLSAIPRVKTGIHELDNNILGLAESEVTLLSGGNASGKSSWLNTLVCNVLQQNVSCALFSGELPPHILKAWIQMVAAGRDNLRQSQYGDGKYYVPNNISEKIDKWMDGRFFLFNNEYGNTWEEVFHDMKELLKANVKLFILDNLMSLDIDLLEGDKNNKQKNLILQLKEFAKKNHVHIIIVAHPRKSLAFLRKADISGTADLTNAVDNVLIAHRVNQDFLKAGAEFYGQTEIQKYSGFGNVIEISKNRMYGVCDVLVGMHYEIESRRFKNSPEERVIYGWEEPPQQSSVFDAHYPFSPEEEVAPF